MNKYYTVLKFVLVAFTLCQCNQPAENTTGATANNKIPRKKIEPKSITYRIERTKDWIKKNGTDSQQNIVLAINRTDRVRLPQLDSMIVPNDVTGDAENYFPFPFSVPYLKDIPKVIFFSYPAQSFGAYELGDLVYTGPVNMGRKKDPTPTGLYYTNWKAEKTTSTFNDEWDLLWNVNIENKLGIGWHQYELPGYPSSHSCLRLQEKDARYLYNWAEQWILGEKDIVKAQGTPVIVFGTYAFGAPKPWLQLVADPHALDISEEVIQQQAAQFLADILAQQKRRGAIVSGESK